MRATMLENRDRRAMAARPIQCRAPRPAGGLSLKRGASPARSRRPVERMFAGALSPAPAADTWSCTPGIARDRNRKGERSWPVTARPAAPDGYSCNRSFDTPFRPIPRRDFWEMKIRITNTAMTYPGLLWAFDPGNQGNRRRCFQHRLNNWTIVTDSSAIGIEASRGSQQKVTYLRAKR
jgi:hypothetical protein